MMQVLTRYNYKNQSLLSLSHVYGNNLSCPTYTTTQLSPNALAQKPWDLLLGKQSI